MVSLPSGTQSPVCWEAMQSNMSADALTVSMQRNVKPEMAELKGKRLIIAAELEKVCV